MTYNPDELEQYDHDFATAKGDDGPNGGRVPPGTYQAQIVKAEIRENTYNHYPELNLHCKIISGPSKGLVVFPSASFDPEPNEGLKGEKPITYLKRLVTRLDLKPPITAASQIPGRLQDMLDKIVEVAVVANAKRPEYPRCFLNRCVGAAPKAHRLGTLPDDAPAQPAPVGDDEIPF